MPEAAIVHDKDLRAAIGPNLDYDKGIQVCLEYNIVTI